MADLTAWFPTVSQRREAASRWSKDNLSTGGREGLIMWWGEGWKHGEKQASETCISAGNPMCRTLARLKFNPSSYKPAAGRFNILCFCLYWSPWKSLTPAPPAASLFDGHLPPFMCFSPFFPPVGESIPLPPPPLWRFLLLLQKARVKGLINPSWPSSEPVCLNNAGCFWREQWAHAAP